MNRYQRAALLIVCALVLATGAYLLFFNSTPAPIEDPELRQAVQPPENTDVKAPTWVDSGQSPQPDYSSSEAKAQNATPVPANEPVKTKPQVIEVKEDRIVTFTFMESLSNLFLNRFIPRNDSGSPSTNVSAKSVNIYFGQELDGFAVPNDNIRTARKTVLDYAFTPTMLKTLQQLYTPAFMAFIVDAATTEDRDYKVGNSTEHRPLTKSETSEMLRQNAATMTQTASIFRIIANDPTITELAGKYLRSAKAVERANGQLQTAISDEKDTTKAGQRLKQAILQRERVKASIVSRIKQKCTSCSAAEAFYLAQWAYRRVLNEPEKHLPTFKVAAEVLDQLSSSFLDEATKLK